VYELIDKKFGIKLGQMAIGKMLTRLGLTSQKLLKRAYQRDQTTIEKWQRQTFPAIANQAKSEDADIFFSNESEFCVEKIHCKTWVVRDHTPRVQHPVQHQAISSASAEIVTCAFWFCANETRHNAEFFVDPIAQIRHHCRKPNHLVLDRVPAHKTAPKKIYPASTEVPLSLRTPPRYATDLNPDEMLWSHVKRTGTPIRPLQKDEKFHDKIEEQLAKLQKLPNLVPSFIRNPLAPIFAAGE